jgi:hypothetical protein
MKTIYLFKFSAFLLFFAVTALSTTAPTAWAEDAKPVPIAPGTTADTPKVTIKPANCICIGKLCSCPLIVPNGTVALTLTKKQLDVFR